MPAAPTVLYLAGTGRSGSTVLAGVLGEVDGFFFAGEVRYLWQRGLVENRLCGCGQPLTRCEFWGAVLERAYGSRAIDARAIAAEQRRAIRMRRLPALLVGRPAASTEHLNRLARLYRAIADESGARVVVDSSKLPAYGRLLRAVPDLDLRVVHLVRDPRAVAYSWQRQKAQPDRGTPGYMQQRSPLATAVMWTVMNGATPRLLDSGGEHFTEMRYEDFAAAPRASVDSILALAGANGARAPFADERTVRMSGNHSVAGNPDRLATRDVEIRPDAEWTTRLTRANELVTTAGALPLLHRYRYEVRPRRGR